MRALARDGNARVHDQHGVASSPLLNTGHGQRTVLSTAPASSPPSGRARALRPVERVGLRGVMRSIQVKRPQFVNPPNVLNIVPV